ncbi:MAG: glycosyltransferase [Verrucomicrobia bacterium]|nr:glycosyltransferase [Verrucomicrobiota bacterium]
MKFCDLTQFYSPASGGVKRYVTEKAAYLRRRRPGDRHVLIVPGAETQVEGDATCRIHFLRSPLLSRSTQYRALLDLEAVSRVLEAEHPDLIECSDPYQLAWRAQAVGRSLGIPVTGYYHSHFIEAYVEKPVRRWLGEFLGGLVVRGAERYARRVYGGFARTLVPSPALIETLGGWGVGNAVLAELGVDTALFRPDGPRWERPADAGRVLAYVGRLAPEKNVRTLAAAFAELHRRGPGAFHFLIVGEGNERDCIESLATATGQVTWLPALPAERLPEIYRGADLFVHPGVLETFGLVTLEAQACGTPVCGIAGTRMDRLCFAGREHWAKANTPVALAEAIEDFARGDLAALGREAAGAVAARYDWDARFAHIFGIYDEILTQRRAGAATSP